ncbi:MAG: TonB-dependent receptor [Flavobacteriales bacterium]
MKYNYLILTIGVFGFLNAQSQSDSSKITLDEFEVTTNRVGEQSPVAHENISKEEIEANNHGVDLPILLDQATSIVTTSDAGAGVGYTGIRVRGTDATRINVTVNGIPFNDAESQGVYWVNMPDISSSTDDIQIQRGVGASTTGASAFGASVNLSTLSTINSQNPYGEISNSYGSFNTLKNTVKLGTGLIDGKWNFEGRLSRVASDGFIDRASSKLNSYYLSGSYLGEKTSIQAVAFSGQEVTYQAWYGIPLSFLEESYNDSGQTYNPYEYENEVDNYNQSHYQLHFTNKPNRNIKLNASLHYTRGKGYFEQYKGIGQNASLNYYTQESLMDYGLENVITSSGDTISETDLIRRRWLDNHFYGIVYSAEYFGENFQFTLGGGANQYLGGHYGEVIWSQYASNGNIRHRYYDNDATKNDINVYGKLNYDLNSDLSAYVDLQQRIITYDFTGLDQDGSELDQTSKMSFFNPKFGFNYSLNEKTSLYAFAGVGNKEPSRDDFTESTPNDRPSHESLLDIEIGYRYFSKAVSFSANFYNMQYNNQLILTGELNDVGSAVRVNIPDSYRRGIELTGSFQLMDKLLWRLNATFSENKIAEFKEFIDNWDTGVKDSVTHVNTNIAFSPSIIGGSQLIFTPFNSDKNGKIDLALISKYVGDQFIDNTSNEYAKLDSYIVNDFRVSYTVKTKLFKEVIISSWIRNLSNQNYISNAWVYRFNTTSDPTTYDPYANAEGSGSNSYNQIGAFNQAGINFFVGLNLKF